MEKADPWWRKILFFVFWLFLLAIVSAAVSLVIVLLLDWYLYPVPPHLTGRSQQKYHNSGLFKRMGWEIPLVVFIVTYLLTTIYGYLKYKIGGDVD